MGEVLVRASKNEHDHLPLEYIQPNDVKKVRVKYVIEILYTIFKKYYFTRRKIHYMTLDTINDTGILISIYPSLDIDNNTIITNVTKIEKYGCDDKKL